MVCGQSTGLELLETARSVLDEVDPNMVLMEAKTMNGHLALMLFPPRMAAMLLSVFGALALVLDFRAPARSLTTSARASRRAYAILPSVGLKPWTPWPVGYVENCKDRGSQRRTGKEIRVGSVRMTQVTALVIRAVAGGYRYGFDVMEACGLPSGTAYPALRRLERAGLLTSGWENAEQAHAKGRPRRRIYELTPAGAGALGEAQARLEEARRLLGALPQAPVGPPA